MNGAFGQIYVKCWSFYADACYMMCSLYDMLYQKSLILSFFE